VERNKPKKSGNKFGFLSSNFMKMCGRRIIIIIVKNRIAIHHPTVVGAM
jgi:orotate phosphoribosyltransferase-like protein